MRARAIDETFLAMRDLPRARKQISRGGARQVRARVCPFPFRVPNESAFRQRGARDRSYGMPLADLRVGFAIVRLRSRNFIDDRRWAGKRFRPPNRRTIGAARLDRRPVGSDSPHSGLPLVRFARARAV